MLSYCKVVANTEKRAICHHASSVTISIDNDTIKNFETCGAHYSTVVVAGADTTGTMRGCGSLRHCSGESHAFLSICAGIDVTRCKE